MNKYSDSINIYYDHSLFFNYTINQFIIHSIRLKNEYMLGKLCSYMNISNNKLYYKDYILQLPKTYTLKHSILYIKKKCNTVNNNINNIKHYNKIHYHFKSKRLLSITIKQNIQEYLTDSICNRIYSYILLKYPVCTENIEHYNIENIYLYNNEDIKDDFIKK